MGERVGDEERSSLEEETVVGLAAAKGASLRFFCDEARVGCGEADKCFTRATGEDSAVCQSA